MEEVRKSLDFVDLNPHVPRVARATCATAGAFKLQAIAIPGQIVRVSHGTSSRGKLLEASGKSRRIDPSGQAPCCKSYRNGDLGKYHKLGVVAIVSSTNRMHEAIRFHEPRGIDLVTFPLGLYARSQRGGNGRIVATFT